MCLFVVDELPHYMVAALGGALSCEQVGEEKQTEDGEEDEELDENDRPQGFAYRHFTEAVRIKADQASQEAGVFVHVGAFDCNEQISE